MYPRLTGLLLRWLRVPPEPRPPHGDAASLKIFRAGRNYLNLRLLRWGFTQLVAFAGIVFWFGVFANLGTEVDRLREERARPKAAAPATTPPADAPGPTTEVQESSASQTAKAKRRAERRGKKPWRPINSFYAWQHGTATFLAHLPRPAMLVIWFFEIAGLVLYILQFPLTLLLARMDFDLRWYMVTDRSLRIRHGVWKVSESTMSFANIQQVVVSQGPLQRLLGLADVKVQSAGGGSGEEHKEGGDDDMHLGLFHSVTNAPEIRDLILERLRRFRESGLGDPDEKKALPQSSTTAVPAGSPEMLAAAQELVAEARALRASLG